MRLRRRRVRATVGLGVLVLSINACRPATAPPSGRAAIAAAVGDTLPFQARLSGGFVPSTNGPTRAAGDKPVALSPDARIAIALIEKRAIESPTPAVMADLGVAYLVQGDIDRAITTLDDAASQLNTAAPWSDLSAAYLAKAERTPARKIELLARALESAEKSLKISKTNDALFNRALACEGLARYVGATAPWEEYAAAEVDPKWKAAASRRIGAEKPSDNLRDRWEERRKLLAEKLKAGDADFVSETVRLFPEAAVDYLEQTLMVDVQTLDAASLLASTIQRETGDSLPRDQVEAIQSRPAELAQAHRAYNAGANAFSVDHLKEARGFLKEAESGFARAKAPYLLQTQFQLARLDWRENALDSAQRTLALVERAARTRAYQALLARVLWQRGLTFNRQWRLNEGLAALRESASLAESSAQPAFAVAVNSSIADALRALGEPSESWEYIGRTLEQLPRLRSPLGRYRLLFNAALFVGRQDLNEAALLFQDAAVREASDAGDRVLTEALTQRAVVNIRRRSLTDARHDFDQATRQLSATPDGPFKSYATAELNVVRAQLGDTDDGVVTGLQEAITFFGGADPHRVPALYLLMARSPQVRADRLKAEDALLRGISTLEDQQARLGDESLRISYFDESWNLFQQMVSLQASALNPDGAFDYAERSRARALLASRQGTSGSRPKTLAEIRASLPETSQLVFYETLSDRLLIWVVSRSNTTFLEQPISDRDLARLVDAHRSALINGRENREANDRLYAAVIHPIASVVKQSADLVLVPDGSLHELAFGTLRDPSTGRYVIEDHALLVTPSATFFADRRRTAESPAATMSALLIGNPAANGVRALPGAEREVNAAAALYPTHQLFVGPEATKERFLAAAAGAEVIHFGGHALFNPEFPLLSRLIFADKDHHEQSLFAHEVARLRLPRTRVVILAACSTAAGAVSHGEGVVSVARPFLASGVPTVIASQWDVDDSATEQLTLSFHRALATSRDPIQALHAAQLAMLRSGDASWALPQSWGAFVAVGTSAR